MKRVQVFAPASIGNFAAGFDVLGAAIAPLAGPPLGDQVEIRLARAASYTADGPYAHRLPRRPEDDLVLRACDAFARAWGRELPPLAIRLHKQLPVGSGLGSSSTSVVATLVALDTLLEAGLGPETMLRAAGETEALGSGAFHLDNVAPAMLGGLRLVVPAGPPRALPFPDHLLFAVASPDLELNTRDARRALPAQVPRELAVEHAQNLAGLVLALGAGDADLRRACLRDLLAEPYRAPLVPGFRAVQAAAMAQGAEGCTLSGAGPAIFAVVDQGRAEAVAGAMAEAWNGAEIPCQVRICRLEGQGARVLS
ncbi:MAG: homoserine kinase [Holophaga sp.]|nr:homoserine kinase [Holophaga sp.]